jgi:hypothetical protein
MADKVKYIQTNEHSMLPGAEKPLAPGDRVLIDEENESHKHLVRLIEAEDPSVEHLSLLEVDPGQEKKAAEEQQKMLAKAEELAAEQRNKEAQEASEQLEEQLNVAEGQSPHSDPTDFPPQDEEAQRLAEQSGPGQRASTQEDVVEEHGAKSGRRSTRGKSSGGK